MYAPETSQPLPESGPEPSLATNVEPPRTLARSADILKVSTRSRPSAVAGAIAGVMRQHSSVEVQCIGAGATNQAIKAIAIARAYLRDDHIDVGCVPFFIDVAIDGEDRTALRLLVERYPESAASV